MNDIELVLGIAEFGQQCSGGVQAEFDFEKLELIQVGYGFPVVHGCRFG